MNFEKGDRHLFLIYDNVPGVKGQIISQTIKTVGNVFVK